MQYCYQQSLLLASFLHGLSSAIIICSQEHCTHSSSGMRTTAMTGLDHQIHVALQEMAIHGHILATIRKNEVWSVSLN